MTRRAVILGTGSALPARRVSNEELSKTVETSDDWIVERTGIRARHFADEGMFSSDLAFEACKNALQAAGKRPQDIDLIIVATGHNEFLEDRTYHSLKTRSALWSGLQRTVY